MKRGAKPKQETKRLQLKTTFTVEKRHLDYYGLKYWSSYLRECIKKKESEIESL